MKRSVEIFPLFLLTNRFPSFVLSRDDEVTIAWEKLKRKGENNQNAKFKSQVLSSLSYQMKSRVTTTTTEFIS